MQKPVGTFTATVTKPLEAKAISTKPTEAKPIEPKSVETKLLLPKAGGCHTDPCVKPEEAPMDDFQASSVTGTPNYQREPQ